jgi:ribosomal RNA-processing protein 9
VTAALKDERLESQGKLFRVVSETIIDKISDSTSITLCGHKASVTCVCLSSTENYIFSGSKDNSIVSWDTETGKKIRCFREAWSRRECGQKQSHEGEVLSIAISTDERYLVSGCKDGLLRVYDVRTPESLVRTLSGHRGAITSLSFRKDSSALFSGSADRCVKHWDLNEMGYIETLFGHQVRYLRNAFIFPIYLLKINPSNT